MFMHVKAFEAMFASNECDEPDYDYEPDYSEQYEIAAERQYEERMEREANEWFCP
jgi:hypothetical protein